MIELLGVEYENVVYFKKAKLDVTRHNFVVVTGHNKDSRISTQTNNGAGKSLFFSGVPNVVYEQTPLATKKSKKDLLGSSDAIIKLSLRNSATGDTHNITQTSSKFVIERNGKDIEARTIALQKAEIARIFPLSEDEFYSYVYLQSQRPLDFQQDKPSERLHFITKVFNLNVYDELKKYFTKRLGEIKEKQVAFDVVNTQLVKVNGMLERLKWNKASAEKLEAARATVKELSATTRKLQRKIEETRSALESAKQLAKLIEQRKQLRCPIDVETLKWQQQAHTDLRLHERDLANYHAQTKKWIKEVEALGDTLPAKKLKKQLALLTADMDSREIELETLFGIRQKWKSLNEDMTEAVATLKSQGITEKGHGKIVAFGKAEAEEGLIRVDGVLQLESILHECDNGECPTCKQSVELDTLRKHIAKAKKQRKEYKATVARFDAALSYAQLTAKIKALGYDDEVFQRLKQEYKALDAKKDNLEEQLTHARRYAELQEELKAMKKPKPPKATPSIPEKKLEEYAEALESIGQLDFAIDKLRRKGTSDVSELSNTLSTLKKKHSKVEQRYVEAQDVISKLSSKASEFKVLRREQKDALAQLEELKPILAKRDLFKSLEKAYSAKGLKLFIANEILLQLEQNLNRYSNLIFAEPFKFTVTTKQDGVHCIVDRGNGKKSDVRLLSGAESDCFRLLFFFVMLIMADDSRRTNFAILDEPDSHMDDTTRSVFIERYLPALRSLVPHVFLITPLSKHVYSECGYMTVVKEKGVSRIIEGIDTGVVETPKRKRAKA